MNGGQLPRCLTFSYRVPPQEVLLDRGLDELVPSRPAEPVELLEEAGLDVAREQARADVKGLELGPEPRLVLSDALEEPLDAGLQPFQFPATAPSCVALQGASPSSSTGMKMAGLSRP